MNESERESLKRNKEVISEDSRISQLAGEDRNPNSESIITSEFQGLNQNQHNQQIHATIFSTVQESSGSINDPPPKIRRLHVNSRGNRYKFPQQSKPTDETRKLVEKKQLTDQDMLDVLNNCACQSINTSCLKAHFKNLSGGTDFNAAFAYVKSIRDITASKLPGEMEDFIKELFYKSLVPRQGNEGNNNSLPMNYRLPGDLKVCRKAFAAAYGFSVYKLNECSKLVKDSPNERVGPLTHRRLKDDNIPDFTYRQIEEVCRDNLDSSGENEIFYILFLLCI